MRRPLRPRLPAVPVTLAFVLVLAMPSLALADPPSRFTDSFVNLDCGLQATDEGAFVLSAFADSSGSGEVHVAYWTEEPPPDEEVLPALEGSTFDDIRSELTFTAQVPLTDPLTETAQGTGTVDATLTPVGTPEPFTDKSKHFRVEGTFQEASVAGTLVIEADILDAPVEFDLGSCTGSIVTASTFQVNPSTIQDVHQEIELDCALQSDDATAFAAGFTATFADGAFGFMNIGIDPVDPLAPELFASADMTLEATGGEQTFEFVDIEAIEAIGVGTLSVSFTPVSVERDMRVAQDYIQKMLVTTMAVSGSLVVETEDVTYEFTDFSSCEAFLIDFHNAFHSPNGPQPGGTAPVNDVPDGALAVEVGDVVRMQTGGASIEAEAPCLIEFDGELFENTWGRTVWFSVEGTGELMTFDPSGSNFDTAIAAYVSADGGLEHVACVDDDPDDPFHPPQSPLTIQTEEGVTYLIQVGGFDIGAFFEEAPDPEFGRLRLEIR